MYQAGDLVTMRSDEVYNKEESKYQDKDAVFISGFTDPPKDVTSLYFPENGECVERGKKYPLKGTVCFSPYFNEENLQFETCALVWCYSEWQKREWNEGHLFLNLDEASAIADKLNNRINKAKE